MPSKSLLSQAFQLLTLLLLLAACSRAVEGDVFLDKNGNNLRDKGEAVVAGMSFTVTKDSGVFKTGLTDSRGHYAVALGMGTEEANYCVQVSQEDIAAFTLRASTGKALSAASETAEPTPQPTAEACAKDGDGKPDCSDPDCCAEAECESDSACQDKEVDKNACPKDANGKPECDDNRCADEPACNTYTVKSGQTCDKIAATAMTLNLDVPLAVDYESRVGKIEKAVAAPVGPGDEFGVEITYPSSCTFDPFILPAAFVPRGLGEAYNPTTHELSLAKAVVTLPSQLITRDIPPFGHDALYTYVLRLQAAEDTGTKDSEITLQPTLTCPNGKKVSASANVIPLKAAHAYSVAAHINPSCPAVGEGATIEATVESPVVNGFAGATFTLVLGGGGHIALGPLPSICQNKGDTVECDLSGNPAAGLAQLAIPFTLEDAASVSFTPKLDVAGNSFTDTAVVCSAP